MENFQLYHDYKREIAKTDTTPLTMPKRAVQRLVSLGDESLPKEIKQRMKENDVESIVFRDKVDSIKAN